MRYFHLSLDVRGALEWPDKLLEGALRDTETGRALSADETRAALREMLNEGTLKLPMAQCDAFDPVTGCPGHAKEPVHATVEVS